MKQMFEWLLDASSQPVLLYDLEQFEIQLFNRSCTEMLCYTPAQLTNKCVFDILDNVFAQDLKETARNHDIGELRRLVNWRTGDNRTLLLEITSRPAKYLGKACRMVAFEWTPQRAALPEAEYRRLIEWLPVGVVIDVNGRLEYGNFKAASLLRLCEPGDMSCMTVSQIFAHPSNQSIQFKLAALRAGRSIDLGFVPGVLTAADGTLLEVEAAIVPLNHCFPSKNQIVIVDVSESRRMATALEHANQQLQDLSAQLITAQETERRNLALELHDEIGQLLSAAKLHAHWLRNKAETLDPTLINKFDLLTSVTDRALNEVRNLSSVLRPPQLDHLGLIAAVKWQIGSVFGDGAAKVTLVADEDAVRPESHVELTAFRIVQESLTNIIRHANATAVRVDIQIESGALTVQVTDDGDGFDVAQALSTRAVGLTGMRERAHLAGGAWAIDSKAGRGTCVTARLPLKK